MYARCQALVGIGVGRLAYYVVAVSSLDIGCGCRLAIDIGCVCAVFTQQMCSASSGDDWADSDVDCPPSPSVKSGCSDD